MAQTRSSKERWQCESCGHSQGKWSGQCSLCGAWNALIMADQVKNKERSVPIPINQIKAKTIDKIPLELGSLDAVLGGGLASGAFGLVGGEPGIGKSTLLLQIAEHAAKKGLKVLYVSGEESAEQASMRAKRLGVQSETIFLLCETAFALIKEQIMNLAPDLLIVDSIQIIYKTENPSPPGSTSQVRDLANEFMHLAKELSIATFLIGHVTKSGDIAGPRLLEHLVDLVIEFEGDRHHGVRLLRSIKNRFGPTDNLAIFHMTESGLIPVANPSELFLEERRADMPGSIVTPVIEGSHALLLEIQALSTLSSFPNPSRKTTGADPNRVALIIAVLEKRMLYPLHQHDLFVSVVGGIKLFDPCADLAILAAIASSHHNDPIEPHTIVLGEVGLSGEVRSVSRIETRLKEAKNLGFKRVVLPLKNMQGLPISLTENLELLGVGTVNEAMGFLFPRKKNPTLNTKRNAQPERYG